MTEAAHVHFRRHRFPAEIIAHAVWLYYRFALSLRDVEDLLAERGISVTFQTVAEWATKFGLKFAHQLRRRSRGHFADKWQLDEMVVTIKGKKYWLWRAVDTLSLKVLRTLVTGLVERADRADVQIENFRSISKSFVTWMTCSESRTPA